MQIPALSVDPTIPKVPDHMRDARLLLTSGDIARAIGTSRTWVAELVEKGELHPCAYTQGWQNGHWVWAPLFEPAERDRFVEARFAAGTERPSQRRGPRQLPLILPITGGRK